jgi:hypothetical protein
VASVVEDLEADLGLEELYSEMFDGFPQVTVAGTQPFSLGPAVYLLETFNGIHQVSGVEDGEFVGESNVHHQHEVHDLRSNIVCEVSRSPIMTAAGSESAPFETVELVTGEVFPVVGVTWTDPEKAVSVSADRAVVGANERGVATCKNAKGVLPVRMLALHIVPIVDLLAPRGEEMLKVFESRERIQVRKVLESDSRRNPRELGVKHSLIFGSWSGKALEPGGGGGDAKENSADQRDVKVAFQVKKVMSFDVVENVNFMFARQELCFHLDKLVQRRPVRRAEIVYREDGGQGGRVSTRGMPLSDRGVNVVFDGIKIARGTSWGQSCGGFEEKGVRV